MFKYGDLNRRLNGKQPHFGLESGHLIKCILRSEDMTRRLDGKQAPLDLEKVQQI